MSRGAISGFTCAGYVTARGYALNTEKENSDGKFR
jgi:hypothetical protein